MNKLISSKITGVIVSVLVIASVSMAPAFAATLGVSAATNVNVNVSGTAKVNVSGAASASLSAHITNITNRADQEITRRINALNALNTRVQAMVKLSATEKSSLAANIQTQLTSMSNLQTKIAADAAANDSSTLKTDVDSITISYRIFALIIPQGAIEAASDRVLTTAGIMNDLSAKFSARIGAAQAAGNTISASVTAALADLNAKIADANIQENAAASEVAALQPDNGSATVKASNTATLKDARSKISVGQQDMVTARNDAEIIVKALATYKVSANASTTVSASTSAQ